MLLEQPVVPELFRRVKRVSLAGPSGCSVKLQFACRVAGDLVHPVVRTGSGRETQLLPAVDRVGQEVLECLAQNVLLDESAASGIMDHDVAGSFSSRMSGARTGMAAENIAAGTKTWEETLHKWQTSPGHNANLLQSKADIVGVAVARNEQTRYKTYWAMVIAEKPPKKKEPKVAATEERKPAERRENAALLNNIRRPAPPAQG